MLIGSVENDLQMNMGEKRMWEQRWIEEGEADIIKWGEQMPLGTYWFLTTAGYWQTNGPDPL